MFNRFGQRFRKSKQGTEQLFNRFGQRFGKGKQRVEPVPEAELSGDLVVEDDTPLTSSESLRSLLQTAIADAEQIVDSIKMRAQIEGEAEATRILAQAKLEVQDIKDRAEVEIQKRAEDILSATNRKAEATEMEAKQKALQYLIKASEALLSTAQIDASLVEILAPAETELKLDKASRKNKVKKKVRRSAPSPEEAVAEKEVEPAPSPEEAVAEKEVEPAPSPEEAVAEKEVESVPSPEEAVAEKEVEPVSLALDSQTIYSGDVEMIIAPPAELKLVSKLYNHLQTIPELRILYTRGSWDQGTTITVVLENPMPLISLLLETPGVAVTPELLGKDDQAATKSGPLMRGGEEGLKRIKLILSEA